MVRRLLADDAAIYRDIRLEALKAHPEAYGASYEGVADRPESYFADSIGKLDIFGAFIGERQVGLAAFVRNEGRKQEHIGHLIQMYVRPEARGSGFGLRLVEHVIAHATPLVEQLLLGVATENAPAIRLYEKAGFEVYGTEPRALRVGGRYIDEYLMVRFLEGTRKEE